MPTNKHETIDQNAKNFLTEAEIKKFLEAARQSRHGVRDFCLMLMAYRHGFRVSELIDIRLKDLDFDSDLCAPLERKSIDSPANRRRRTKGNPGVAQNQRKLSELKFKLFVFERTRSDDQTINQLSGRTNRQPRQVKLQDQSTYAAAFDRLLFGEQRL